MPAASRRTAAPTAALAGVAIVPPVEVGVRVLQVYLVHHRAAIDAIASVLEVQLGGRDGRAAIASVRGLEVRSGRGAYVLDGDEAAPRRAHRRDRRRRDRQRPGVRGPARPR